MKEVGIKINLSWVLIVFLGFFLVKNFFNSDINVNINNKDFNMLLSKGLVNKVVYVRNTGVVYLSLNEEGLQYIKNSKTVDLYMRPSLKNSILDFLNLGYINGSFFQGLEISPSITWGVKNIFWGFDVGFAFPVLKQEYVSSIEANYDYFYLDTLLGGALNIWNFNPYIGAGVGGYYFCASPKKDSKEKEIWVIDMQVEGIVGVDYKFKFFALGITYKLKWLKSLGFADSYGISAGFTW